MQLKMSQIFMHRIVSVKLQTFFPDCRNQLFLGDSKSSFCINANVDYDHNGNDSSGEDSYG